MTRILPPACMALGFILGLFLSAAGPVWSQAPFIVRFIMAREGGPTPAGETTAYEASDPKAVAWAQFATTTVAHTVVFRWIDPQQRLQRVSPSRIVTPGEEFHWDEMPIRGGAAADLPGLWVVELHVDERLAAAARFSILPERVAPPVTVRHQTTLATRSQESQTGLGTYRRSLINALDHLAQVVLRLRDDSSVIAWFSAGTLWGTSGGLRGSGIVSYSPSGWFFAQAGVEGSSITDYLETPAQRIDARAAFFDLRYHAPERPTFSLSYRRDAAADDRMPSLTDFATTTWMLSSSHFSGRFSLAGTYAIQDLDDRTDASADVLTRTLTLTGTYVLSPSLFLFATRTGVTQEFGATPLAPAFQQRTETTSARLNYTISPSLQLAVFFFDTDVARSDALLASLTAQRGVEVSYRPNAWLMLKVLTQWQTQNATIGGVASVSDQRLSRYEANLFLPRNLTVGAAFSPQTTMAATGITQAEVWTAFANYYPIHRFFFSGTYTLTRTTGPGQETTNAAWALSGRYAPTPRVEYQATASLTDAKFPLLPAATNYSLTYQLTAILKY